MRTAILVLARARRAPPARGLASNILGRTLENLSLTDLKQEAKRRGLSPSGKRATLITRIQHVEKRAGDFTSSGNDGTNRSLATAATAAVPQKPSVPTLDINLPDISPPQDTEGPPIPFVPDFWESSRARTPDAIHHNPAADPPMPKVLIASGTHASSPSYNIPLHSLSEPELRARDAASACPADTGLWGDVAADLGLSPSFDVSASLLKARDLVVSAAQSTTAQNRTENRPPFSSKQLDPDEVKGLWIIVAILGGSWLAGGFFDPSKKKKSDS